MMQSLAHKTAVQLDLALRSVARAQVENCDRLCARNERLLPGHCQRRAEKCWAPCPCSFIATVLGGHRVSL